MAIFNDKESKEFRKHLRNDPTYAERALWNGLRGNGVGAKFRRQESVGPYVVDFYCPELRLAIEVDGISHEGREDYDSARDKALANWKVTTVRFRDTEVLNETERVLGEIGQIIQSMRNIGRSVRTPSTILSKDERARQAVGMGQPPPAPSLKRRGL